MHTRHLSAWLRWGSLVAVGVLLFVYAMRPGQVVARDSIIKQAAEGRLRSSQFRTPAGIRRALPMISSGAIAAAQSALAGAESEERAFQDEREEASDLASSADPGVIGLDTDALGCNKRTSQDDIRVNQDCTYRRQAEELIKINPTNPRNLIAGQNDSRIGFNHCGFDFSFDGGQTWGDGIPPFFQRLNSPPKDHTIAGGIGTNHTYDAASDPALAFDSRGNAYFSCIVFDVNTNASGLLVARSPAVAGGSFYNNVPATGASYVVVEDNSPNFFHDKEFIAADFYPNSRFRDTVYATWTLFEFNPERCTLFGGYCGSPIFFSKSTDGAVTWSKPKEISGRSKDLCFFAKLADPKRNEHDCTFNQGSDPSVLPDGTIVVVFNNGNTPEGNPNAQQLAVISRDGGETWSKPVKVGDDILVGEPLCDFGRGPEECIPGAFIRTNDFPRIAVDKANGDVYAVWQDYRFGEFDLILSRSTDGGRSWKESVAPVNPSRNLDHYFPAIDIGDDHRVAVSYYRTERIPNESQTPADGWTPGRDPGVQEKDSDYFLAGGSALGTPFSATRVARPFSPPDGVQAGFNGDYSGLAVIGKTAYPIWSDTRNSAITGQGVIHDEDIFIDILPIPGS